MQKQLAATDRAELIAQIPLFYDIPRDEIIALASSLRERTLETDELLFAEDDLGNELFLMIVGQVEVLRAIGTPDQRLLGLLGPGEFIGERSLFGVDQRRSATVRATTPCQLLEIGRDDLHALIRRNPALVMTMLRIVSERLAAAHTGAIRDLQERNQRLHQAYAELQAAQVQLIEKERIEHELQVAYDIQMSILPRRMPVVPNFSFAARILPARSVGGDFFDFIPLHNNAIGIAIGDVTDKGVPAAIFMAQARALLRAEASRAASPRETLERVNRHLLLMNDAGLFVTLIYGILDVDSGCFQYARAGHELPLLAPAHGDVCCAPWMQGMALGIVAEPPLDEQTLTLAPGDSLLLYTDGATEAHDAQLTEFGVKRLAAVLDRYRSEPADMLCERLLTTVVEFQAPAPQHDDITLVVMQFAR